MKRKANITDIFRIVACFCIVWFHSSYFGLLDPPTQATVSNLKMYLITWAMPFFLVSSSRFALKSMMAATASKFFNRINGLFLLIMAYIVIYDIPNYISAGREYSKYPFHMGVSGGTFIAKMKDLWTTIVTANYSPVYFLDYLIIIYIFAFIISKMIRLGPIGRKISIGLLFFYLFCLATMNVSSMKEFGSHFIIGYVTLGLMCIGFLYEILNISQYVKLGSKKAASYVILASLLLPIAVIAIVYGRYHGGEFSSDPFLLSAAIWATILFLVVGDRYKDLEHPIAVKLSEWGQKYSMGIFLLHFFTLIYVGKFLTHAWTWIGFVNPSLFIFVCINVGSFFVSLGIVYVLKKSKYTRWLVELEDKKPESPVITEIDKAARKINEWHQASKQNKKAETNMLKVSDYLKENKMM